MEKMDQIVQALKKSDHILIASHANPDGDAIGSVVALGLSLKRLNKNVTLYNESRIPAVYRFLPAVHLLRRRIEKTERYDAAVILDCGDVGRLGSIDFVESQAAVIINIDHHITNTRFGDLQIIDTQACATAEIVYRLISAMAIPIDKEVATALYTGILTDTGSFRFSNTNKAAFSICREMVQIGVDPYEIAQHVFGTYPLSRIKLLNLALDTIEISDHGKLSLMTVTQKMLDESGTRPEDLDGMINYARGIEDTKVTALIQELANGSKRPYPPKFHVSLRSNGVVDVAQMAAALGGGGHCNAAGFSIEASLEEVKEKLAELTEKI